MASCIYLSAGGFTSSVYRLIQRLSLLLLLPCFANGIYAIGFIRNVSFLNYSFLLLTCDVLPLAALQKHVRLFVFNNTFTYDFCCSAHVYVGVKWVNQEKSRIAYKGMLSIQLSLRYALMEVLTTRLGRNLS